MKKVKTSGKKMLAIGLGAAMLLTLPACTDSRARPAASVSGKAAKPTVITAYMDAFMVNAQSGQKQFLDEIQKETGIELKLTQPNHNEYMQKVDIAFASGQAPDIAEINNTSYVKYASNGALYDMTGLIKNSSVYSKMDPAVFDSLKVDGKIYGAPKCYGKGLVTYMRKDWLDRNGLKIPTTYDEYVNALKVFAGDPDGNGKKDTIGVTSPGIDPSVAGYLPEFYQGWTGDFIRKNGKWVDGFAEPEMKAVLKRLQDAYAAGLIDTEVVTNKTSTCRDKWNAGKVGAFTYWAGAWDTTLSTGLKKSVPDGVLVPIRAVKGARYSQSVPDTLVMNRKVKNPAGIFKYFLEWIHDGGKGTMLFLHGVEGVHYKMNSDGTAAALPSLADPKQLMTRTIYEPGMLLEKNFKDPMKMDEGAKESQNIMKQDAKTQVLFPPSENYSKNDSDVVTIRSKIMAKVVVQHEDIDQAVNEYRQQTRSLVEPILKDFEAAGK